MRLLYKKLGFPVMQVLFLVGKIPWRRDRLLTPVFLGFPCGSAGKESASDAGDLGLLSGLGKSPGEGKGYPLQYSGLENSMDCIVHVVTKSQTRLSNVHFNFTCLENGRNTSYHRVGGPNPRGEDAESSLARRG